MLKHTFVIAVVAGLVLALVPAAQAQLVPVDIDPGNPYVPQGVGVGEQFRLVFVTDGMATVNESDINFYNNFVTTEANSVPALNDLGMSWLVIGATQAVNARTNTLTRLGVLGEGDEPADVSVPFYRLDGALVAVDNDRLWDTYFHEVNNPTGTSHVNPVNITQSGAPFSDNVVTGSSWDGMWAGHRSLGRVVEGKILPIWGHSDMVNNGWMHAGDSPGGNQHFYGMSGIFTVVPEPSTIVLLCIGLAGFGLCALRRRK